MWLTQTGKTRSLSQASTVNQARRGRRPNATSVLLAAVVGWVVVWALASVYYTLRPPRARALRFARSSCWFESRGFGYLDSRGGAKFSTMDDAKTACSADASCVGVTYVPWESAYVLKTSLVLVETFDGQKTFVKRCKDAHDAADVGPQPDDDRPTGNSAHAAAENKEQAAAAKEEEEEEQDDEEPNPNDGALGDDDTQDQGDEAAVVADDEAAAGGDSDAQDDDQADDDVEDNADGGDDAPPEDDNVADIAEPAADV